MAIGRTLRELGEAIDALPVLPPPEEEGVTRCGDDSMGVGSIVFEWIRRLCCVSLPVPVTGGTQQPLCFINTQTSTFFQRRDGAAAAQGAGGRVQAHPPGAQGCRRGGRYVLNVGGLIGWLVA